MKDTLVFLSQLAILWAVNQAGYFLADLFSLAVPGNVLGMIILFILLLTKVINVDWIGRGAAFLNKHLAFFFIPIAVGLMSYGGMIAMNGGKLALIVFGSSVIGMLVTGTLTQVLSSKAARKEEAASEQHHTV